MENASLTGQTQNYNEEIAKETTNDISPEWYDVLGGQLDNPEL
jgi:hypothetical protein